MRSVTKVLVIVLFVALAAAGFYFGREYIGKMIGETPAETKAAGAQPGGVSPPSPGPQPPAKSGADGRSPQENAPVGGTIKPRMGFEAPTARTPGRVRLATYNMENMFDDKDDPALSGDFEDKTMATPKARLDALAKAIKAVDPDIIGLEEVESKEAITWFRDTYLAGMGFEHIACEPSGDPRGIDCAVLSKFPIVHTQTWAGETLDGVHPPTVKDKAGQAIRYARTPLRCDIEIPPQSAGPGAGRQAYKLTVFVVHHKSGKEYGYQREAEAKRTLEHIQKLEKDAPAANIALIGDFNAIARDASVQVYTAGGLYDVFAERIPRDPRYNTHQSNRGIDYIMVNRNLRPEIVPDSKFILGTPMKPDRVDWDTTPAPAGYASDHCPVAIDLVPVEAAATPSSSR